MHAAKLAVNTISDIVCRDALIDALSPLGTLGNGIAPSQGAIYLFARLPEGTRQL